MMRRSPVNFRVKESWLLLILIVYPFVPPDSTWGQDLWSFKPVRNSPPPQVKRADLCRTPVDFFLLSRLEQQDLAFQEEANRRILLRRLKFDLHGLPPSPEEIAQFVSDYSPRAYEELVDRLLASPRYGERWARHWLDVARYTESQGFEYDHLRPNGWHYRDYVIHALNSDKPYNQFVQEQIAGDVLDPDSPEAIIATSLLVCGAYDQAGNLQANQTQKALSREDELEDLIATVGQGILGITINCARCHAHKFDPVPLKDYYSIKAVFQGVRHGERPIGNRAEIAARSAESNSIKIRISDPKEMERAMRELKPVPISYAGLREQPSPTKLLKRGDVQSPGEEVAPNGLSQIPQFPGDLGLVPNAPEADRRKRFAEWVTDPRNPLTPRVIANRVWLYHFGQGIVSTPNDFGNSGGKPTHPELLDWLANYLMAQGWSVKALHRVIVCSAAYRQNSAHVRRAAELDADNELLWRYKPRRLEAEAIRDSMLAISGAMNWQMGGPSFRPFDVVSFNSSSYFPRDSSGAEFDRRTIYRANVNSGKDPLLDALDCPDPSVRTPRRMVTITPLQALSLMNNPFVERQARQLAARVSKETGSEKYSSRSAIERIYEYVLSRRPTQAEMEIMFTEANERGLWHVCWALLNSTEFLYVR
jgi:hypothetical protein